MNANPVVPLDALPPPEAIAPVMIYLLSDRSIRVNGQLVRFTGNTLGLYPPLMTLAVEEKGRAWDVDEIASAFEGPLGGWIVPSTQSFRPS